MFNDNVLSSSVIYGAFVGGRAKPIAKDVDYELGGIAIQDASQGLDYQTWKAYLQDDNVILSSPTRPKFVAYTAANITEISFTFDSNMNFTLAMIQNGEAKLYWYDATTSSMTLTNFGNSVSSPKVTLDDKRTTQSFVRDVIFAYVKNNNLYFRMQRDRYKVEYLLKSGGVNRIKKMGMNRKLRLQFLIE